MNYFASYAAAKIFAEKMNVPASVIFSDFTAYSDNLVYYVPLPEDPA